jgi:FkbM family methyltransferase
VCYTTEDYYSNYFFYPRYAQRAHEPLFTRLLVPALRVSRCFADVGANLGYFTTLAGRVAPELAVYAFEMDALLEPIIRTNTTLNEARHVTTVPAAVGAAPGTIEYTPHAYSFLLKIASIEPSGVPAWFWVKLSAPVVRRDDYFADKTDPDLLKIDIDGAEAAALRGMSHILSRADVRLFLEVHPSQLPRFGSSIDEVLGILFDQGFHLWRLAGHRHESEGISELPRGCSIKENIMVYCSRDPARPEMLAPERGPRPG